MEERRQAGSSEPQRVGASTEVGCVAVTWLTAAAVEEEEEEPGGWGRLGLLAVGWSFRATAAHRRQGARHRGPERCGAGATSTVRTGASR